MSQYQMIECSLCNVSLSEPPPYTALSYVWGDPTTNRPILVNNAEFQVTENLETALQHLRKGNKANTLWVDAICINQADDTEKADQVSLMRTIYSNAELVLIWLGPASNNSDNVIGACETFCDVARELNLSGLSKWVTLEAASPTDLQERLDLFVEAVRERVGVDFPNQDCCMFMERPWWSRIWVFQELCKARKATFMCGEKKISYSDLDLFTTLLDKYKLSILSRLANKFSLALASNDDWASKLEELQEKHQQFGSVSRANVHLGLKRRLERKEEPFTLYRLLLHIYVYGAASGHLGCTDDRDRIYALLGLAEDAEKLHIRPDYRISVADLYIGVSKSLLMDGYIDLLALCQNPKPPERNIPSWVTEWNLPIHCPFGDSYLLDRPFAASAYRTNHPNFRPGSNRIFLEGLRVGNIAKVGTSWNPNTEEALDDYPYERAKTFIYEVRNFCKERGYGSEEIARILIADIEKRGERIGECVTVRFRRASSDSVKWYNLIERYLDKSSKMKRPECAMEFLDYPEEFRQHSEELEQYLLNMRPSLERRVFCSGKEFVGLGPPDTQNGDAICIFHGSKFPYIIRKAGLDAYKLIGEAYVHKIMDGEFVNRGQDSEIFSLC